MRAALVVLGLGLSSTVAQARPPPRAPASVAAPAPPRVAIVVEVAVGITPARAGELAAALASALGHELVVEARGGAAVSARLPPGGLADDCLARPACVVDLARRLDVDEVLFVALVQLGDRLQVDSSWTDATGARTASRPRIVLGPGDDADQVFRARAVTLLPEAGLRPRAPAFADRPAPGHRHPSAAVWTAGAVAVVGLGAGAGLGLSMRSAYLGCQRVACTAERRQEIRTRGILADVGFGVAASAAITGAILYFRSAPVAERQVQVGVVTEGGGAAIVLGGRF